MKEDFQGERLVQFRQLVPDSGHAWVEAEESIFELIRKGKPGARQTKERVLAGLAAKFGKNFDPFAVTPPLSRTLAELDATEETVREFADRYGLLGIGRCFDVTSNDAGRFSGLSQVQKGAKTGVLVHGETLEQWSKEIGDLQSAWELWDAIREPGNPTLKGWVRFEKSGNHRWAFLNRRSADGSLSSGSIIFDTERGIRAHRADLLGDEDIRRAATFVLQEATNDKLREHTASVLLYSRPRAGFGVYSSPKNLLGAMWLQLANAVGGERDFRQCRECNNWFEVDHHRGGEAKRREFCRAACRVASFGKRKLRALKLHKAGARPRAIAEELGSELAVVKRWITEGGEEKRLHRSRSKEGDV